MKLFTAALAAFALTLSAAHAASPPDIETRVLHDDSPECFEVIAYDWSPGGRLDVANDCEATVTLICPLVGACRVDDEADPTDRIEVLPGDAPTVHVPVGSAELGWESAGESGVIAYVTSDPYTIECGMGMGCDASGGQSAPAWLALALFGLGLGLRRARRA